MLKVYMVRERLGTPDLESRVSMNFVPTFQMGKLIDLEVYSQQTAVKRLL